VSKRLHTVEIEGYGPVTFRALTKKQMERIYRGDITYSESPAASRAWSRSAKSFCRITSPWRSSKT
jgi:hypothetical protein